MGSTGQTGTVGTGPTGITGTRGPTGTFSGAVTFIEGPNINMNASVSGTTLNNYPLGNFSFYKLSNSSQGYSITGFANGVVGRFIVVINNTANNQTFQQENSSSLDINRFVLGVANKTIGPNQTITFIYVSGLTIGGNPNQSRWVMTSIT
jgi:hypothetical protein